jgi:xanthine dehydrogenase accessory factor
MNIIIRGGGDLGSGIAFRLHRVGWNVVITEVKQPLVLRRSVSFANAIYENEVSVEGIIARYTENAGEINACLSKRIIPVLISPENYQFENYSPDVVIDARLLKKNVEYSLSKTPLVIGLGPGFEVGSNCHVVIETNRGHYLGRTIWSGRATKDTGTPGTVQDKTNERVLRAPTSGTIKSDLQLGTFLKKGDVIGYVDDEPIIAPFDGCLRGLMHDGINVNQGLKIGDLDPRLDKNLINYISEKALAIAGGVLEAILSYQLKTK